MTKTSSFYGKSKNKPAVWNNTDYATIILGAKPNVNYERNISSSNTAK